MTEQESVVEQTLRSAVITDLYLKSQISVVVHVLEADGYVLYMYQLQISEIFLCLIILHRSILATVLNAVFLALMQAGISMYDMLVASTVGYVKGKVVLDMNQTEIAAGGAYIPLVVKARTEEVVFMQLDSTLSFELLEEAMLHGVKGCKQIRVFQESVMKRYMQSQKERQGKK